MRTKKESITTLLVVLGFVVRIFLIFPGPLQSQVEFLSNKADLRNYYWPAQSALRGENPYDLWATGQSGEFRADLTPLELLMFKTAVRIWNDPRAIQVLFAIADSVNIALLGILLKNSQRWLPFQLFYALGPLTIYNFVLVPEDKTIVLTLSFLIFILLSRLDDARSSNPSSRFGNRASVIVLAIIVLAALLASFKWLVVFFLFPLLVRVSFSRRDFLKNTLVFGLVVAAAHVPWFPSWWYMYSFRLGRVGNPIHIAPSVLLNSIGLYNRLFMLGVLVVALLLIYVFFWLRRIDILETAGLSIAAGVLWTPDMDPVHLSLIVLYLLLVIDWSSRPRQVVVWALGAWVAFVYAVSTRGAITRYGLPDLRLLTGAYGSVQMILLSYLLLIAVGSFYIYDRLSAKVAGGKIDLEPVEC